MQGVQNTALAQPIGCVILSIKIPNSNKILRSKFYVVKQISGYLPTHKVNIDQYNELTNLQLADPNFGIPSSVDALLGINLWVKIVCDGLIKTHDELVAAQKTIFGWIIYQRESEPSLNKKCSIFHAQISHEINLSNLNSILTRFWEIEDLPIIKYVTPEQRECEKIFVDTHFRRPNGRYVVRIPFNDKLKSLGKSKTRTLRQFFAMERKMQRNALFKENYMNFMREFEELGHLTRIHENNEDGYYTPHHGVVTSEKFRVVFNASSATTSGISLNECQLIGEKLQSDLSNILMKFRCYEIAVTADIVKMFRQVEIHDDHKKYQKILWRYSPNEPVGTYVMNRVMYGHAAAPYLAVRAMQQCAMDHQNDFPIGAKAVLESFYVDDALAGADTIDDALKLKNEMSELLALGKFELAKWCSNKDIFSVADKPEFLELNETENKSVLGLRWLPFEDHFAYKVGDIVSKQSWTKREVLSQIGRLYDPNGYISPLVIIPKILIQSIWQHKIDWDDQIPINLQKEWEKFLENLPALNDVRIPRWLGMKAKWKSELHCFCDASEKAYAAVVYVKTFHPDGYVTVQLVQSKTKVAPLKQLTLPRLELCGAHLLSKLAETIYSELSPRISNCYFWTDSEIVLTWINKPSNQLKTFVANRIAAIQHKTVEKGFRWKWVAGEQNPADIASRGIYAANLIQNELWWNGPHWLTTNEGDWPKSDTRANEINEQAASEMKVVAHASIYEPLKRGLWFKFPLGNQEKFPLLDAYSNYRKLKRVMAYILRAIHNFKQKSNKKYIIGPLTGEELQVSTIKLVQLDQRQTFHKELNSFETNEKPNNGSIWLDRSNKILRLLGRVQSDNLTFDEQYPIILSPKGKLAKLIIKDAHLQCLHGGIQQTLQLTRQNYWIYQARRLTKSIISHCLSCLRFNLKTQTQLMAPLPTNRTTPQRPFRSCAVDYMGPVGLSSKTGRNPSITKAYVCVFVCTVTRAIHLELVNDASTTEFIAAFRRIVSVRGQVARICSDNGTNFVGANNFLKQIYAKQIEWATGEFAEKFNLKWSFITPNAPHHGGLHEAAVKSTKKHLLRVIGQQNLTFSEYYTLLKQVEACVNSRPICPISDDPNDLVALTPSHFLIGEPLITLAEEANLTDVNVGRLTRWQMVQQMSQNFWKRWHDEYVMRLIDRTKWKSEQQNLQLNDLVIVREDNLPPSKWTLGRIIETFPSADGFVRTVKIRTKYGEYLRPITKLGLLEPEENRSNN